MPIAAILTPRLMDQIQKVAIYARVSTRDKQETENQLRELRAYSKKQGWRIVGEYVDHESGGKADRPQFHKLFEDAHKRKFEMVLFWALDRFSREGVLRTLTYLNDLESSGVEFKSYAEQYIDSSGLFKEAILAILATLAKQERIRLSERVKAGLDRARSEGRRLGRPKLPISVIVEIKQLHQRGISKREISRRVRYNDGFGKRRLVGWGSVRRVLEVPKSMKER
jgi:DNA invertase Pin-like site-specific DNA recombinase